ARASAATLRRTPAATHRCPTENALLISLQAVGGLAARPVVLLMGRPVAPLAGWPAALVAGRLSPALERQVSSRPQRRSPVLPAQQRTRHARSRPCRRRPLFPSSRPGSAHAPSGEARRLPARIR